MLYKRGDTHGDLHPVRKDHDFFYDEPVPRCAVESGTSYGRSEIKHLSNSRKESAAQALNAYGIDKSNIPTGTANCQD